MSVVVALALLLTTVVGVSAQTHHVVNGWGPDLDLSSWLSGRVFSVGDKLWFKHSGGEGSIVEVQGLEEFASCNLTNPIRMFTNDVVLDKQGVRYFTSSDPEMCSTGLKLPVPVQPGSQYDPPYSHDTPPFDPYFPDTPSPYDPYPPLKPTPPYDPPVKPTPPYDPPVKPTPPYDPPVKPTPPYDPPVKPTPPYEPSAAPTHWSGASIMIFGGLLGCYYLALSI